MERESFESEETAAILNKHYVCVKVDREERPDVDKVYVSVGHLGSIHSLYIPSRQSCGTFIPVCIDHAHSRVEFLASWSHA